MRAYHSLAAGAAFLSLGIACATAADAQTDKPFAFDLPSEPLAQALRDVATKTQHNVVASAEVVKSRTAPPLVGSFTAEEAIARLLEGTGLTFRSVEGTLIVEALPFPGGDSNSSAKKDESSDIVVTGTHVRGASPTSPVIVLTRKDIEESGATSVEALVRDLPQNVAAGVGQENFSAVGAGADITQNGAGINLRGLGQRATLVLINGRRVAPSDQGTFVDVSLIPISAIDHVEILADGASAIYGSDAVGGVVNFILRDNFNGIEPVIQVGTTTDGGGQELLAGLTAGGSWNGGHALLSYEYRNNDPILAKDRSFIINLPGDWEILPREKRNSLYGTAKQDLTNNLALDLTGIYATRKTQRTFTDATLIDVGANASAHMVGATAALEWSPGASWLIEADANYFGSKTHEIETQAGLLYNHSDTFNSYGELTLKGDGTLVDIPGGPLKLAFGSAVRREHFTNFYQTPVNLPSSVVGSRTVSSAYGELNIPLFSSLNREPGIDKLTLTAAGRLEHYEKIGSTFNPKLGFLWSPVAGVSVRSSYGTSFRAPLLSESFGFYDVFLLPLSAFYLDPSKAGTGVGAALLGDNPNVKPERSRSLSLGVDIAPPSIPKLRFSTNFYRISFTNRIGLPTYEINLIGNPAFAPLVTMNPAQSWVAELFQGAKQIVDASGPNYTNGGATPADVVAVVDARITNSAETRTSGLDFLLDYGFDLGRSSFNLELNADKVFRFDNKLTTDSPWIRALNTPFNPVAWRARAGFSWTLSPITFASFVNYTGSYQDNRTLVARPVHSNTTVDASLALDGTSLPASWLKNLRIALTVQNLFDTKPPFLAPDPSSTKGVGYDTVNASGEGRLIALQLRTTL